MSGENCAASCQTKDHETFGECLRGQSLRIAYCRDAVGKGDATREKKFQNDLKAYRDAVRQGIEPDTTNRRDVDRAVRWSNEHGVAYQAEGS